MLRGICDPVSTTASRRSMWNWFEMHRYRAVESSSSVPGLPNCCWWHSGGYLCQVQIELFGGNHRLMPSLLGNYEAVFSVAYHTLFRPLVCRVTAVDANPHFRSGLVRADITNEEELFPPPSVSIGETETWKTYLRRVTTLQTILSPSLIA